jgi:hypothetical protein
VVVEFIRTTNKIAMSATTEVGLVFDRYVNGLTDSRHKISIDMDIEGPLQSIASEMFVDEFVECWSWLCAEFPNVRQKRPQTWIHARKFVQDWLDRKEVPDVCSELDTQVFRRFLVTYLLNLSRWGEWRKEFAKAKEKMERKQMAQELTVAIGEERFRLYEEVMDRAMTRIHRTLCRGGMTMAEILGGCQTYEQLILLLSSYKNIIEK